MASVPCGAGRWLFQFELDVMEEYIKILVHALAGTHFQVQN